MLLVTRKVEAGYMLALTQYRITFLSEQSQRASIRAYAQRVQKATYHPRCGTIVLLLLAHSMRAWLASRFMLLS